MVKIKLLICKVYLLCESAYQMILTVVISTARSSSDKLAACLDHSYLSEVLAPES